MIAKIKTRKNRRKAYFKEQKKHNRSKRCKLSNRQGKVTGIDGKESIA